MGKLDGKIAAVTGGASGIGEATVRLFVEEGARVAFADRDGSRGSFLAGEIGANGGQVLFVEANLEREAEAISFIQRTMEQFAGIDVLVNNAGIRMYHSVTEASEESWDTILAVNVKSYAFCAKAAIPAMRRAGARSVINMASSLAVVAGNNTLQYDTSKAAVAGLTRGLTRGHALEGIRVNAVCPGPVFTPFFVRRAAEIGKPLEELKEELGRGTMLQRMGTPREVAACVLFLASDDASYITGASLFVDGGQTAW